MNKAKKAVSIIIYAVIIVVAAITVTETGGFFRTLPFVFVLPAVATLFYNKRLLTALLVFVATFLVSASVNGDMVQVLLLSAISAVFALVGIYAKRLIVTALVCDGKAKRTFCIIYAAAIFFVFSVSYFIFFGNPVSQLMASSDNRAYISENYGENEIKVGKTIYNYSKNRYFTNITFTDESPMNADISVKNRTIIDGYNNYYEYKYMSQRAADLSRILSASFKEELGVGCNIGETDILFAPNVSDVREVYGKMVFDVYFGTQTADEATFAKKCAEYKKAVDDSGFEYCALKFYGGFAGDFYYEMTAEADISGEHSQLVLPFNENHLVKRESEADYKEFWNYGR